jgi:hypothetical protein
MAGLFSRVRDTLKHGWNVFRDDNYIDGLHKTGSSGIGSYMPPFRNRPSYSRERSIISSIYTRLSIDVSGIDIRHVQNDEEGRYLNDRNSGLQDCLTVDPNKDQGPRQFRQDIAMTLFEKGVIAIVPVETDLNPGSTGGFNIQQLRVGEIVGWLPDDVRVNLYDDRVGERKIVTVPKSVTAVIENPLYAVMNEYNSTLQRLNRKINLLDEIDDQIGANKLDLIIQLPYVVKSEARRQQADQRLKDIEFQLTGNKYGIAYTDGTEKIQQLNRPVENDFLKQIEYLTQQLYVQLGLTEEVMNGTADEKAMLNYFNRTVVPLVQAISEAMKRTFLTKTARTQGQSIAFFRNPFALVPMEQLAEIADKFTRNEILSANEIRQGIGFKPSKDPKADKLINSNMPQPGTDMGMGTGLPDDTSNVDTTDDGTDAVSHGLDEMNGVVDQIYADLGIEDG